MKDRTWLRTKRSYLRAALALGVVAGVGALVGTLRELAERAVFCYPSGSDAPHSRQREVSPPAGLVRSESPPGRVGSKHVAVSDQSAGIAHRAERSGPSDGGRLRMAERGPSKSDVPAKVWRTI